MRLLRRLPTLCFLSALLPTGAQAQLTLCDDDAGRDAELDAWISDAESALGDWVTDFENSRVQIIMSEARTDETGAACLDIVTFREGAEHVYVASAIKPLLAVVAINVLEEVDGWDLDTELRFDECVIDLEPAAPDGATSAIVSEAGTVSMRGAIRSALVHSSNPAYNRIYDLVGRDDLNTVVRQMGFESVRLSHRLSIGHTDPRSDAFAPAVEMESSDGWVTIRNRRAAEIEVYPGLVERLQVGDAHYHPVTDERVEAPFDFGTRNAIELRELHALMVALTRPELAPGIDLGIDDDHRGFVVDAMTRTAMASTPAEDVRHAPLLGGLSALAPNRRYTYVSKSGYAYGFHVENAWVRDDDSGREVFVTIAVHANEDRVINDNRYEYDTHSFPLMDFLGERIGHWMWSE